MKQWKARFNDEQHDVVTRIENNFSKEKILDSLRMEIDGLSFVGMEFDDFELEHEHDFESVSKKFKILKWGKAPNYTYWLQRYSLTIEIPVQVIEIKNNLTSKATISFSYSLVEDTKRNSGCRFMLDDERVFPDKVICHSFYLAIGDEKYLCDEPSLDFETSLLQICKEIKDRFYLKCCFGCLYSDYSPYGKSFFAMMQCYLSVADQYIRVSGKYGDQPIWKVYESGEQKQETYVCDGFKPRINCLGGYRGNIY